MNSLLSVFFYPIKYLLQLYISTLRIEVHGKEEFEDLLRQNKPVLMALWHNKLILLPLFRFLNKTRLFQVVVSFSKDGDLPARVINSYKGFRAFRVRHNARHDAVSFMVEAVRRGECIVITPDGPRGPRHVLKPGVLFVAEQTNASIVPFTWTAEKVWKLKSWDKFEIPKPFSKVRVQYGPEVTPEKLKDVL